MSKYRVRTTMETLHDIIVEADDEDDAADQGMAGAIKKSYTTSEVTPVSDDEKLGDVE